MKKIILLFVLLTSNLVFSQEEKTVEYGYHKPFSLEVNIGIYNKIRGKFEYRFSPKNALLIEGSRHYGAVNPGAQTYLEYRHFYREVKDAELFFGGKFGYGKSFSQGGTYGIFGFGFG